MCKHLVSLVYTKKAGSAVRKAVLGYMADRASEEGDGIYTSKGRIARETEVSQSSVKRAINEFIAEGLVAEVGQRKHANGVTTVYAINIAAVQALPDAKTGSPDTTTYSGTQSTVDPVQGEPGSGGTPTRSTVNPHPVQGEPQTTLNHLEPPKIDQPSTDPCGGVEAEKAEPPPTFPDFWAAWPLAKQGKQKAERAFRRLSAENRRQAVLKCRSWAERWRASHPQASDLHPTTYLNGRRWEDEFNQAARPHSQQTTRTIPRDNWRPGATMAPPAPPPPPKRTTQS